MKRFLSDFWQRLINPNFWIMDTTYNKQWDEFITNNIDKIKLIDEFTCEIDGVYIWIANYPFSYTKPYPEMLNVRASISTIKKFRDNIIEKKLYKQ